MLHNIYQKSFDANNLGKYQRAKPNTMGKKAGHNKIEQ